MELPEEKIYARGEIYNLPERVFREITMFAKKHSIQKVILFGSRARGTHRERSDIDIVVYGGNFDSFYWDIKENVHSLLIFDIVEADGDISEELGEEIVKDGVVIYEKT
ncbi:nucleotidyltransferase family protein [Blautia wexlerae]|uniref:nucleotidyltransferase family protein n=1 Tax=Blautia wexlerae TaxID=418240 RepID=UPI003F63D0A3